MSSDAFRPIEKMPIVKITPNERNHYTNNIYAHRKFNTPEEEYEYNKTKNKTCNKCNEVLSYNCFKGNTSGKDPFDKNGYRLKRGDCNECNKKLAKGKNDAQNIAKKKGMLKAPDGTVCEICKKSNNIVFDHHHTLNQFRGWLCNGCNRSIGMLGEDIHAIVATVNYMNKSDKKKLHINEKGEVEIIEEDI